ncbi:hypothetical protein [Streptomyces albidoflavus]|uniref:hypothetical protein n=1 Tax=Streptomyces albidoflavus TaxID=1886 RepID=UPI0033F2CFEC
MTALLYVLEFLAVAAALVGVALVYVPAALILGGVLGVVVAERALASGPSAPRRKGAGQ